MNGSNPADANARNPLTRSQQRLRAVVLVVIAASWVGCGSDAQHDAGDVSGGTRATGGVNAMGGTSTTAATRITGGTQTDTGGAATGGNVVSGGWLGTGGQQSGASGTGGAVATGGISGTGGNNVGGTLTGGSPATGGAIATGGLVATGGIVAFGGTASSGGSNAATGGATGMPIRLLFNIGIPEQYQDRLYSVEVNGDTVSAFQLTPDLPGYVSSGTPVLSPDGTRLLFHVSDQNTGNNLAYMADISQPGPVTAVLVSHATETKGGIYNLEWSPDSKKILLMEQATTNGATELYWVDVATTTPGAPSRIGSGDAFYRVIRAHFVGSDRVALIATSSTNESNVYVANAASGTTSAPIAIDAATALTPELAPLCVSPDARSLAFVASVAGGEIPEMWVVDTANGPPYSPTRAHPIITDITHRVSDYDCQFSPDGAFLVYLSGLQTTGDPELTLTPIAQGQPGTPNVIAGATRLDLARFTRSGTAIVYPTPQGLYLTHLTQPPLQPVLLSNQTVGHVLDFTLSPDTSQLLYRTGASPLEAAALYRVQLTPTPSAASLVLETTATGSYIGMDLMTLDNSKAVFDVNQNSLSDAYFSTTNAGALPQRVTSDAEANHVHLWDTTRDSKYGLFYLDESPNWRFILLELEVPSQTLDLSSIEPTGEKLREYFFALP
jgi:WD40 repeat protein